ncbi:MAG: HAMP domain-containing sensor histidine kinase, partial [Halobacteria archaeon]|nr:HAMP domain-containing sensor histidine kinase [Halobacteria archaeon]
KFSTLSDEGGNGDGDEESISMTPDDKQEELEVITDEVLDGEVVTNIETTAKRKDGSNIDVSISVAPLQNSDDRVRGAVAVITNITNRKEREQRLQVLNRVLRHNLRNDMNVVMGYADMIGREASGEMARYASKIEEHINEVVELSDKYRRAEDKLQKHQNQLTSIDVSEILSDELEMLRDDYPEAEIITEIDGDVEIKATKGISLAIENLVENGIEHNDSTPPVVKLSIFENGDDEVVIRISDNGPGIPEEEKKVLLRGKEDPLNHGSGVGLWTVNWIVNRSRGRMEFTQSELGGETVEIYLKRGDSPSTNAIPNKN